MQTKTEIQSKLNGNEVEILKQPYQKPALKTYGLVKQLTQATGSVNGDAGQGMMPSDRSTKEHIVRIGTHPLGIGLYLFDYKPEYSQQHGMGRQFGVMADEVESVLPEAVSIHPGGYKQVSYAMLGISHRIH